jgi:hypothetical protein
MLVIGISWSQAHSERDEMVFEIRKDRGRRGNLADRC